MAERIISTVRVERGYPPQSGVPKRQASTHRRARDRPRPSFYFSRGRRHTRLTCDWSSDVCSSDLLEERVGRQVLQAAQALLDRLLQVLRRLGVVAVRTAERLGNHLVDGTEGLEPLRRDAQALEIGRASCRERV